MRDKREEEAKPRLDSELRAVRRREIIAGTLTEDVGPQVSNGLRWYDPAHTIERRPF